MQKDHAADQINPVNTPYVLSENTVIREIDKQHHTQSDQVETDCPDGIMI